jgi:hypothetical protein
MLDQVEVRGIVSASGRNPGDDVGARDDFDNSPDDSYRHLLALIPGTGGLLHCQTYPCRTSTATSTGRCRRRIRLGDAERFLDGDVPGSPWTAHHPHHGLPEPEIGA